MNLKKKTGTVCLKTLCVCGVLVAYLSPKFYPWNILPLLFHADKKF